MTPNAERYNPSTDYADKLLQPAIQRELAQGLTHSVIRQTNMLSLDHPAITQRNSMCCPVRASIPPWNAGMWMCAAQ